MLAPGDVRLRAALWRPEGEARGFALLLSGRTEFIEKLSIPAAELVRRGFAVASIDWRGQGLSQRLLDDPLRGHVGDFSEYQQDLEALLAAPELAEYGPATPTLAIGHSMGAAILMRALAEGRVRAGAAALSAPMLGIAMPLPVRLVARAMAWIGSVTGQGERWPPFGNMATPYVLSAEFEGNLLTTDRAIWDWLVAANRAEPRLNLAMPTLGWFRAAELEMAAAMRLRSLGCPATMVAGADDRVVSVAAIRKSAARLGTRLLEIPGCRHEPMVEAPPFQAAFWQEVDALLETS